VRVFLVGDVNPLYELQWVGEILPKSQFTPLGFFLPDSRRVAVNQGSTVRFYDARSGAHVDFIRTHLNEVNLIAFSNSGDVMAVGSSIDKLIEVYDLTNHTLVDSVRFSLSDAPLGKSRGEASEVLNQLIFSPDDTKLLAGVERTGDWEKPWWRQTLVYDRRTLSLEKTLMGGSFVAFAPDGRHVALFRNGNQWRQHPKTGETRVISETSVQILTYPEMREIVVFPSMPTLRWVGWAANDALCMVRGEFAGRNILALADPYSQYRGAILRYEIDSDLISAADTMPAPSPVREISSTEIGDLGEE
jgi:WD40 repeat protein